MNTFLDKYDRPKLNQENTNFLNRSITYNKIESLIKSLKEKKSPWPDRFSAEFYHTFKEEPITTLPCIFHEIEREGTLPKSFYEAGITLIPNWIRTKQQQRRELQANLLNECRCKNPQQNNGKSNQQHIKMIINMNKSTSFQRCRDVQQKKIITHTTAY
jgi:hypothetical protein